MTEGECTEAKDPLKRVQRPTAEEECSENEWMKEKDTIINLTMN